MPKFVERDLGRNFYRDKPKVIFDGNNFEAQKREKNRKRTARQQGIPMSSVGWVNEQIEQQEGVDFNRVNDRPKRRTRGRGRKINYKLP